MALCEEIATFKKERALPVLDAAREEEKLRAVASRGSDALRCYDLALFRELMALSRKRQEELLAGEGET